MQLYGYYFFGEDSILDFLEYNGFSVDYRLYIKESLNGVYFSGGFSYIDYKNKGEAQGIRLLSIFPKNLSLTYLWGLVIMEKYQYGKDEDQTWERLLPYAGFSLGYAF